MLPQPLLSQLISRRIPDPRSLSESFSRMPLPSIVLYPPVYAPRDRTRVQAQLLCSFIDPDDDHGQLDAVLDARHLQLGDDQIRRTPTLDVFPIVPDCLVPINRQFCPHSRSSGVPRAQVRSLSTGRRYLSGSSASRPRGTPIFSHNLACPEVSFNPFTCG